MGKEKKIKWRGMVPVRVRGVDGHINQNQIITVDETIANNLLQDDFWEAVKDESAPFSDNDKIMGIPDEPAPGQDLDDNQSNKRKKGKGKSQGLGDQDE